MVYSAIVLILDELLPRIKEYQESNYTLLHGFLGNLMFDSIKKVSLITYLFDKYIILADQFSELHVHFYNKANHR